MLLTASTGLEIVTITTSGDRVGDGGQGGDAAAAAKVSGEPATSPAGSTRSSRRCWPARSTSRCTRPRTSPASWPRDCAAGSARAGRAPRTCCAARLRWRRLPRERASVRAACAARRSCARPEDLRGGRDRRQRRHAPAAVGRVGGRAERLEQDGEDDLDAIVLARAGLVRLGREAEVGAVLDPVRFVPAPGQGVLALEGRAGGRARAGGGSGDHRRGYVRVPAGRAGGGERAGRELSHTARGSCDARRLRLPDPARVGRTARRLGSGAATSCWAASTIRSPSGCGWRSECRRSGPGSCYAEAEEMTVEHA